MNRPTGIIRAFHIAIERAKQRGWDKIYVFVDIHETMIKPNYDADHIPTEFYDHVKEVMKYLSDKYFFTLILYTCSWPKENEEYLKIFEKNGIHFSYINKNPEVTSKGYGCYDDKPYINILIDDKAGFDPEEDWAKLLAYFSSPEFLSLGV